MLESLNAHKKKAAGALIALLAGLFAFLSPDARRIVLEAVGAAPVESATVADPAPVDSGQ